MKTFSRLSLLLLVFFGTAFMLIGGPFHAHAQSLEVLGGAGHQVGETVNVVFRVEPNAEVPLSVAASGLTNTQVNGAPATLSATPSNFLTTVNGLLTVRGTIQSAGAYVVARWDRPGNADDLTARADLVSSIVPPILKVLAPEPCGDYDYRDVTFDPKKSVKVGDVFSQQICIQNVTDLASWQMNVVFNPSILEVVSIEEGDFLETPIKITSHNDPHYVPNPNDPHAVTEVPVDALFFSSVGAGWIPVRDWKVGMDNFNLQEVDPSPEHLLAHPPSDIADYLKRGTENRLFTTEVAEGKIAAMQARVGPRTHSINDGTVEAPHEPQNGVTGTGILMTICFRVLEFAEEPLGIHNVQLSDSKGDRISYSIQVNDFIVVTDQFPEEDVNRDGYVNIQDLVLVAGNIGLVPGNLNNPKADANGDGGYTPNGGYAVGGRTTGAMHTEFQPPNNLVQPNLPSLGDSHSRVDVNNDGIVNVLDLIQVALSPDWGDESSMKHVREANVASLTAPSMIAENLTPATIQAWINLAQVEHDGSAIFDLGIHNLQTLLVARIPSETKLLLNYPNPFNPETWIPYQLAESTEVTVMIHSMNGALVRTIELGHQAAGTYQSKSQAAYWDGRNEFGEQVASGVYFYTLTAGNFTATGKMLVRK